MNVKETMRKFTLLILLSQTVIFFNSCAQNSNTSTEEELSKDKKCQTIKRYLNTHKTSLERKVKAPQNYEAFDSLNGTIKLINYESEGRSLKGLLESKNIESEVKKKAVIYLHGGFALGYQDIYDCKKFTDNGFIVMAPSFRAENGNEGFYEFLFGEVKDAESAVKWLSKQEYVDSDSIYVFGHSTGGALSLSLSLRDDLHVQFGGRYPPQLLGQ